MGDTMTRDEVEAVIAKMASVRADCTSEAEFDARRGDFTSANLNLVKSYTMRDAATMLRDALAESEAPGETDPECDALCPPCGLSEGQRCQLRGRHTVHLVPGGTSWPDRMTERRAKVKP